MVVDPQIIEDRRISHLDGQSLVYLVIDPRNPPPLVINNLSPQAI